MTRFVAYPEQKKATRSLFVKTIVCLCLLMPIYAARAHVLLVLEPPLLYVPVPALVTPKYISRVADFPGPFYYDYDFQSFDGFCKAFLTLEKTGGPEGIMGPTPIAPPEAVKFWEFSLTVASPPPPGTIVTYKLTWVAVNDPAGCGTATEIDTITIALASFDEEVPATSGTGANILEAGIDGDPVNTFSGELFNKELPDLRLGGPMPVHFSRYYAARLSDDDNVVPVLGENWLHNYQWEMAWVFPDPNTPMPRIVSPQGRAIEFDENLNLLNQTDVLYQLVYDASANEYSMLDPVSNLRYVFGDFFRSLLLRIEDGHGNSLVFTYDQNDRMISVADGLGRTLTYTYDAQDRIIKVSDGMRNVNLAYTDNDLTSVTDVAGNTTTYSYAAAGLLASTQRPEGNIPFSQTFDGQNRVVSQTNADGHTSTFAYGANDTNLSDPEGNLRVHTHSAEAELTGVQDQNGQSFTTTYDSDGRVDSLIDRQAGVTSFGFHAPSGRLNSITYADGSSTSRAYTSRAFDNVIQFDLTQSTLQDGSVIGFGYDAQGNRTSITDAIGNTSNASYNSRGRLLTTTNPLGGTSTFSYDARQRPISLRDPALNTRTIAYDAFDRVVRITQADSSTFDLTYDSRGNPTQLSDENGLITKHTFDSNSNLTSITNPLNDTAVFGYDGNDRVVQVTDPLGGISSRTFDSLNRHSSSTDPNGNTTNYIYDQLNRLGAIQNASGESLSFTFDAEAILSSVSNPQGHTLSFDSDALGRIVATTSPLGFQNARVFDNRNRIISQTDALGATTNFTYDAANRLSELVLPGGKISNSYNYNDNNQLTGVTDPDGNTWQYAYDSSGREISRTDPNGNQYLISYDNRNHPSVVTYPAGLGTLNLTFDAGNRLTKRSYSDATVLNFSYTATGRLASASQGATVNISNTFDANDRLTDSNGITATYDAGGRLTSVTLAPGKTVTYAYDASDRLVSVTDWIGGLSNFSYDPAGRFTSMTRPNGIMQTISLDDDSRLVGMSEGDISTISLLRDAGGRITGADRDMPLIASATGVSNAISVYDGAAQTGGAGYDAMGRLTASAGNSYTWNLASRLTMYTRGGGSVSATYNAAGLRLSRSTGADTRIYVWNYLYGLASVSTEKQAGADLNYYVHTPSGALLYRVNATSNARQYYHFDELGNTRFVTNDASAVVATYAFTPYGQITASSGALDNPFTWQGQLGVMDEGNGLFYMRARYYDSTNGRFLSRDPLDGVGPRDVSPYQYAFANPMKYVDISGEEVRLSGYGRFGLDFQSPGPLPTTNITSRLRLQFDLTTETDGGVVFGARFRPRVHPRDGRRPIHEPFSTLNPFDYADSTIEGFDADPFLKYVGNFLNQGKTGEGGSLAGIPFGDIGRLGNDSFGGYPGGFGQTWYAPVPKISECELNRLKEAVAKALKKLKRAEKELKEDTPFLTGLDLLEFGEGTVSELRDAYLKASDALDRAQGIDPTKQRPVKNDVQGVVCLA